MDQRQLIDEADQLGADVFFTALYGFYGDKMPEWTTLDMFARDGSLTLCRYVERVRNAHAWELESRHTHALAQLNPAEFTTGECSYALAEQCEQRYDMVVVDSPQGLYQTGRGEVVAEHFQALSLLPLIMRDRCVIVLYVNKRPYDRRLAGSYGRDDYDAYDFDEWMVRRSMFYGQRIITDTVALQVYDREFTLMGFRVEKVLLTPCLEGVGLPPSFRLGLEVVRR